MQTADISPRKIPAGDPRNALREMQPIFWDTDIERMDVERCKPFIIARMLEKGGLRGYFWVEETYSEAEITDVVCHRRDLSPLVRNHMLLKHRIPREAVTVPMGWWSE